MPDATCSIAATLGNCVTTVMRDPAGVVSKANFIDAGMFSSSTLSSPPSASNESMGRTAVNFQEPLQVSPFGPVKKYSARPPTCNS